VTFCGVSGTHTALPASRNWRFQFPTHCSDTFARRAASATVISPARIDSTIRTFSSAGNTGGLAMTIRLLDGQTRKKRALPGILRRDIMSLDPTGAGQRRWSTRWKPALNAFDMAFDGRLSAGRK
jgi:hypothetical protein